MAAMFGVAAGRVLHAFEIQVAKATNGQKNGSAEERIDSRACVVNMCVLGEKSCFRQNSVFHSIDF